MWHTQIYFLCATDAIGKKTQPNGICWIGTQKLVSHIDAFSRPTIDSESWKPFEWKQITRTEVCREDEGYEPTNTEKEPETYSTQYYCCHWCQLLYFIGSRIVKLWKDFISICETVPALPCGFNRQFVADNFNNNNNNNNGISECNE